MLRLPEEHRKRFKEPFGELFPELEDALPTIEGKTVYTVGDVVTHNFLAAGGTPAVAVIDGYTMRSPCGKTPLLLFRRVQVKNPAGALTEELGEALEEAVLDPPTLVLVEGEEDLAVIPLALIVPDGSIILYGQPGEGVVVCRVTADLKNAAKDLLSLFVPASG
ncbi:MAG: GTP-dependent dephospho-CoA kinase family protein [Methanofollis sp.]|nr:GTP-dependent dephospho-CoA kinase family protein [Methanofollis sp.]